MSNSFKKAVAVLFVFCGLTLFVNKGLCSDQSEKTITGVISAIEWDDNDNVIGIAISVTVESEDDTEVVDYIIGDTEKGKELFNYIDKKVKAVGTVKTDEDGNLWIDVNKYTIISSEEESEEETTL